MNELELLQKLIDKSNNVVFFGGAGVSTDSGIKDFRGKNGLYKKEKYLYPPEYLLSHNCLYENPHLFYSYYRENMNTLNKEPNITHKYLSKLENKGKLKAIVTQNIDGLHEKAGSKKVLNIHGSIYYNHCSKCLKEYPSNYIFQSEGIPKCPCGGLIRPDVVLYGEMLPPAFNEAEYYIKKSDLLIAAGTSLTVEPAASLIKLHKKNNIVIINETKTAYDNLAKLVINKPLKEVFSKLKI